MQKNLLLIIPWILMTALLHLVLLLPAQAVELLNVNPVAAGGAVSIEITADIPMTYSYYKIPGQAKVVVDIADANSEKIQPLIIVDQGPVSSITVGKAQVGGLVVSRVVFNLVSEREFAVKPADKRKKLIVNFGWNVPEADVTVAVPGSSPVPVPKPAEQSSEALQSLPAEASPSVLQVASPEKTVPVIPALPNAKPVISRIVTGTTFIDIEANRAVTQFRSFQLRSPERIVIDVPDAKSALSAKVILLNKLGITKVRIGQHPGNLRMVFDAAKAKLPAYEVSSTDSGLRISFK